MDWMVLFLKRNKTKVLLLIMLMAGVFLVASCTKKESEDLKSDASNSTLTQAFSRNSPDLYGEIKAVSGNNLTIALLEIPQRRAPTDEEKQKMRESRKNNDQGQGENSQNNRQRPGVAGSGEKKYTGKSETITIPADVPITAFDRGNRDGEKSGKPEEKKLSLSDIKVGTMVQIWYKKDSGDKKEIQSIRVVQIPGQ